MSSLFILTITARIQRPVPVIRLAAKGWWFVGSLFFLSGCTTFYHPSPSSLPRQDFTFPAAYEDLWESVLGTLNAELVPIAEQESDSGTITTDEFPIQKAEFVKWAKNARFAPSGFGTVYLRVLREGLNASRLEIRADFQSARRSVIRKKGKRHPSTGVFEKALAARFFTYLVAKKYPTVMQLVVGCNFRWTEATKRYEVLHVETGSFGEEQGFKEGDVLLQVDGVDVSIENFFPVLSRIRNNVVKTFTLSRQGEILKLPIQIFYLSSGIPWIGMRVEWDETTGAFRIVDLAPSSPAGKAGLQAGDLLLEEEGIPLTSWKNYYTAVTNTRMGSSRKLLIGRKSERLTAVVAPERFEAAATRS